MSQLYLIFEDHWHRCQDEEFISLPDFIDDGLINTLKRAIFFQFLQKSKNPSALAIARAAKKACRNWCSLCDDLDDNELRDEVSSIMKKYIKQTENIGFIL